MVCARELRVRNSGPRGYYSGGAIARTPAAYLLFPRRTANFARSLSPPWLIGHTRRYICSQWTTLRCTRMQRSARALWHSYGMRNPYWNRQPGSTGKYFSPALTLSQIEIRQHLGPVQRLKKNARVTVQSIGVLGATNSDFRVMVFSGLFYAAFTTVLISTWSAFLMATKIAERFSIVGFPDFESMRCRLLLDL